MVFLLDSTLLVHLVTNKKACKSLIYKPFRFCALYRERDLNPHSHHWPKDFKSFVSTDSTIAARNRVQRYNKNCIYTRKNNKTFIFLSFSVFFSFKSSTSNGSSTILLKTICIYLRFSARSVAIWGPRVTPTIGVKRTGELITL